MPSFKKPTRQQIDTVVQRMRSPEFAGYFFSRLENPLWVVHLKAQGLFGSPPPPIQVEGVGMTYVSASLAHSGTLAVGFLIVLVLVPVLTIWI